MAKIRYEVDPHNRLIVSDLGRKSLVSRYRTVLDGRFKIGKNNSLIYHAKISSPAKGLQQIKLKGKWSLNKKHDLEFSLNRWGQQIAGNKLTLKGKFINLKAREIAFAVMTKEKDGKRSIYTLRLSGRWKVDKNNRLSFDVAQDRKVDALQFQGSWKLKNNTIIYSYRKQGKGTGPGSTQSLAILGYWDIKEKYRLRYILKKKTSVYFDFRTSLGVPVKRGNRSGIKFELGAGGAYGKKPQRQTIIIFGKWKIDKQRRILFEVRYNKNESKRIEFAGRVKFNKDYTLEMDLKNLENRKLGIKVKLSRRILDAGEAFLSLSNFKAEKRIDIGLGFRW